MKESGYPYQHPSFPAGTLVRVSQKIVLAHPFSKIAGKTGMATVGTFYHSLAPTEPILAQMAYVPILFAGDHTIHLVEAEYVFLVESRPELFLRID